MDISPFFDTLPEDFYGDSFLGVHCLGGIIEPNTYLKGFPNWNDSDIVLVGFPAAYGSVVGGASIHAPNLVRKYLKKLALPDKNAKIADLGNLKQHESEESFQQIVILILSTLLKEGKTVIQLGGTHDLAFPQYMAFEKVERFAKYVAIDARLDMYDPEIGLTQFSHHNAMLQYKPSFIREFTVLGGQNHYLTEPEKNIIKQFNINWIRLGELTADMTQAEPFFRHADMVSVDMSAVRNADAPGVNHPSPAGFSVEQFCYLARYAGMAYQLDSISIHEINPAKDINDQTSHLAALFVWYFMEGFYQRLKDAPNASRSNVKTYRVLLTGSNPKEIVFFQHEHTKRWWMEVIFPAKNTKGQQRFELVACHQSDYETACKDVIPDRWWATQYRLANMAY